MTAGPTAAERQALTVGWDPDPARSMSLSADAYTDPRWFDVESDAVFSRTWQWVCHVEKVRDPGSYTTTTIADRSVLVVAQATETQTRLERFTGLRKHPE